MPLRWIEVENYRAIARARVTFGETTVLFGENDSGRTSITEALLLCLGGPGETLEERLRPIHFHRRVDGDPGPLHIRLAVEEEAHRLWQVPASLDRLASDHARRELIFDFRADLDPATDAIGFSHTVSSPGAGQVIDGGPDTRDWLRALFPVLWLQPGQLTGVPESAAVPGSGDLAEDPALRDLTTHHRNILTGNATDMAAELEAGAEAARQALERYSHVFAGSAPMMDALVAEILHRRPPSNMGQRPQPSTGAQKIAVLLVLGAMVQMVRQTLRDGPLPEKATPILLIENPEVNLHPITLASVWRTLRGITWQKIVATHSAEILSDAPLTSLRRLTRRGGVVEEWSVAPEALTGEALRKVAYHLRSRRSLAMFARCWLLVEGETEYWVLPELARLCGYDFAEEGIACVEFAQSGVAPLATLADQLGIARQVMVDGDEAGRHYADTVAALSADGTGQTRVSMLMEPDIEHCFWANGYADVIRSVAKVPAGTERTPTSVIHKAIERTSKPFLALSLVDAVARRGPDAIPPVLREVIEATVAAARV
jgi:putative ATP-dependent endonuclease of OLD family